MQSLRRPTHHIKHSLTFHIPHPPPRNFLPFLHKLTTHHFSSQSRFDSNFLSAKRDRDQQKRDVKYQHESVNHSFFQRKIHECESSSQVISLVSENPTCHHYSVGIRRCGQLNDLDAANTLFHDAKESGESNQYVYSSYLHALCRAFDPRNNRVIFQLWDDMVNKRDCDGFGLNGRIANEILSYCNRMGYHKKAEEVWQVIEEFDVEEGQDEKDLKKNIMIFGTRLNCLCQTGRLTEAKQFANEIYSEFPSLPIADKATIVSILLSGIARSDIIDTAYAEKIFSEHLNECLSPNESDENTTAVNVRQFGIVCSSMMLVYSKSWDYDKCLNLFEECKRITGETQSITVCNTLLQSIHVVSDFHDTMKSDDPDEMEALIRQRNEEAKIAWERVDHVRKMMKEDNVSESVHTFVILIRLACECKDLPRCVEFFREWTEKLGRNPSEFMIAQLVRCGIEYFQENSDQKGVVNDFVLLVLEQLEKFRIEPSEMTNKLIGELRELGGSPREEEKLMEKEE